MVEFYNTCNGVVVKNLFTNQVIISFFGKNLSVEFTLNPNESKLIEINEDGVYYIEDLTNTKKTRVFYYFNLLENYIKELYEYFCNCDKCCEEKKEDKCSLIRISYLNNIISKIFSNEINTIIRKNFNDVVGEISLNDVICINNTLENDSLNICPIEKLETEILKTYLILYKYFSNTGILEECQNFFMFKDFECCIHKFNLQNFIKTLDKMATFHIQVSAYINQPPTIGDVFVGPIDNRTTIVLTANMFKQNYNDPENDELDAVRIDSIAMDGVLKLNGVPVTAGTIITKAQLDNNELTYTAPDTDLEDNNELFTFSVRDVGSMQWVS